MINFRPAIAAAALLPLFGPAVFAEDKTPKQTLFTNVNIFNGKSDKLAEGMSVLVEDNLIKQIAEGAIIADGATVIDGGGRTLTPGFIDNHVHFALAGPTIPAHEVQNTWEDMAVNAVTMAEMYLMQGVTTVRDAGGQNAGFQRSIDAGLILGPRIYPSGAFIGPRGGHSDFQPFTGQPGNEGQMGFLNMGREADGVDAILKAARNNFRQGSSQLKVMQSGGVTSAFDPWQMDAYTDAELEAVVAVAEAYGSYAMAHSYRTELMVKALNAGIKSIEHGFGYTCEVGKLMEEKGAYITTNLTAFDEGIMDVPAIRDVPASFRKAESSVAAFAGYLDNMRECPAKRGFHVDCVGNAVACNIQVAYEKHLNNKFFGPYTSLVAMTSVGGEIAALSGEFMNPYPEGKLGVIEEGAYADILLLDGNPLEDFSVVGTGDEWFTAAPRPESPESILIIMKDGKIYKNTLADQSTQKAQEDEKTITIRLVRDGRIAIYGVFFGTDSAEITDGSNQSIDGIASALKANPDIKIAVVGHTDNEGSHEHNMDLSKRRADALVAKLVEDYGINSGRLFSAGASFLSPVASNLTVEGRGLNRRVELVRVP